MPVSFSVDPSAKLVRYTVAGDSTIVEASEFLDAAVTDPCFRRGFGFLGDRRRAPTAPTAEYIRAAAELLRSSAGSIAPCRWAVVVSAEEQFGAVRVWALLTKSAGVEIAPFLGEMRALEWLARTSP